MPTQAMKKAAQKVGEIVFALTFPAANELLRKIVFGAG
jgi:hypothetical protein